MRNPVRYRAATAIRGLVALLFAIPLLFWAEVDTNGLVVAFAGYALLSAVASIIAAYDGESRTLAFLSGANLVAGVLFLMGREIDLLSAVYALGAWAMMTGILEMFASGTVAAQPSARWHRAAAGLTMTGLGVLLGLFPEPRRRQPRPAARCILPSVRVPPPGADRSSPRPAAGAAGLASSSRRLTATHEHSSRWPRCSVASLLRMTTSLRRRSTV